MEEKIEELLDHLPAWNKKIADKLKPIEPFVDVLLIITILICVWALFWNKPQYKLLWLVYLWSP